MTINKNAEGGKLTISIEGRLDTMTSPQLEAELKDSIDGIEELIFDFSGVEYISSAGLHNDLSDYVGDFPYLLRAAEKVHARRQDNGQERCQ